MSWLTAFRTGQGGYARITGTTAVWNEVGDELPGQPTYDNALSFYPPPSGAALLGPQPIYVRGGRDFAFPYVVRDSDGEVMDITGATFVAQIKRSRYHRYIYVEFSYEIGDAEAGEVTFKLGPEQTTEMALWIHKGVWDAEMILDGIEYTVIPESDVTVHPAISQEDNELAPVIVEP